MPNQYVNTKMQIRVAIADSTKTQLVKLLRDAIRIYSEFGKVCRTRMNRQTSEIRIIGTNHANMTDLYNNCELQVLPNDPKARRLFVTSGGLKKVQLIEAKPGSTLMEYITVINSCFPEEIVRFYSPGYPDTLLDRVEQYAPQLMTVLRETGQTSEEMQTEIVKSVARDDMSSESGSTQATDVADK